jgi:hypothetical protein
LFFLSETGGELYCNRTTCQSDYEFQLALPMPTDFCSDIPAKTDKEFLGHPKAREIFTLSA